MTSEFKTAIALDPDFADSYMQLAYAQARAAHVDDAMAGAKKAISLNPRNQQYYFNIAELYLQKGRPADALRIYRALTKSSDRAIASRAASMAEQIEQMQASMMEMENARRASGGSGQIAEGSPLRSTEASRGQTGEDSVPIGGQSLQENPAPAPSTPGQNSAAGSSMRFLKGTIASVDCSSAPAASMTVASAGKRWQMQVRDSKHVLVIGTTGFSCDWKGQKVALNYRETGELSGTVVTIEIQ